ncbi:jg22923 [Pararge aegeria aegeria]|uniref:Jg22923 protein n=1 Tax=Pararge aegeria aegeria TaxID=348720 RepID=A0A8S4QRL8_9NEOP|nr:jg22923 [Pararge aegeria aegeria]
MIYGSEKLSLTMGLMKKLRVTQRAMERVVAAMQAEDEAWIAMITFCEIIMAKKEAAERDRERADPSRRRPRRADGNHRPIPSDQ